MTDNVLTTSRHATLGHELFHLACKHCAAAGLPSVGDILDALTAAAAFAAASGCRPGDEPMGCDEWEGAACDFQLQFGHVLRTYIPDAVSPELREAIDELEAGARAAEGDLQ